MDVHFQNNRLPLLEEGVEAVQEEEAEVLAEAASYGYRRRAILIAREEEYTERASNLTGKKTSKKKTGGFRPGLARAGFV